MLCICTNRVVGFATSAWGGAITLTAWSVRLSEMRTTLWQTIAISARQYCSRTARRRQSTDSPLALILFRQVARSCLTNTYFAFLESAPLACPSYSPFDIHGSQRHLRLWRKRHFVTGSNGLGLRRVKRWI